MYSTPYSKIRTVREYLSGLVLGVRITETKQFNVTESYDFLRISAFEKIASDGTIIENIESSNIATNFLFNRGPMTGLCLEGRDFHYDKGQLSNTTLVMI